MAARKREFGPYSAAVGQLVREALKGRKAREVAHEVAAELGTETATQYTQIRKWRSSAEKPSSEALLALIWVTKFKLEPFLDVQFGARARTLAERGERVLLPEPKAKRKLNA